MNFFEQSINEELQYFYKEEELNNSFYLNELPTDRVECQLKIKSDLILSGLPFFVAAFNFLGANLDPHSFEKMEGKKINKGEVFCFELPFNIALTGERVALNLLQTSSSISTFTQLFVEKASPKNIKILDTRKTTPGLRKVQKYAVRVGGGYNHRMSQTDVYMIKDNHKNFFGSLSKAHEFFNHLQAFYNPTVVEIHDLFELKEAIKLDIKHVMLDNFTPVGIKEALEFKVPGMTFELSGGININNIDQYLIEGVDAISMGALTYGAPHVDISLKIKKII